MNVSERNKRAIASAADDLEACSRTLVEAAGQLGHARVSEDIVLMAMHITDATSALKRSTEHLCNALGAMEREITQP